MSPCQTLSKLYLEAFALIPGGGMQEGELQVHTQLKYPESGEVEGEGATGGDRNNTERDDLTQRESGGKTDRYTRANIVRNIYMRRQ
jgi:hypothetical protein